MHIIRTEVIEKYEYLEVPTHNVYDIVNTVVLLYQTLLCSLHVLVHRTIIRWHPFTKFSCTEPGLDFWQGQDVSLFHNVQTGSGAHPASYPMSSGGFAFGAWSWDTTAIINLSSSFVSYLIESWATPGISANMYVCVYLDICWSVAIYNI
jgi:hypothetical protein